MRPWHARGLARLRGFTILETIIALWIALLGVVVCAQMMKVTLQSSAVARDQVVAVAIAENALARLDLAWQSVAAFHAGPSMRPGADTLDGPVTSGSRWWYYQAPTSDADNPRFTVEVMAARNAIHSPARNLAGEYLMTDSERLVKVRVRWRPDEPRLQLMRPPSITLVGVIREPPRRITGVSVSVGGNSQPLAPYSPPGTSTPPAPAGGVATITATASDGMGTVPDTRFHFYLQPVTGNATLDPASSRPGGNYVELDNYVLMPSVPALTARATGGSCRVNARCLGDAREFWERSTVIQLASGPVTLSSHPGWPWTAPSP